MTQNCEQLTTFMQAHRQSRADARARAFVSDCDTQPSERRLECVVDG
jgi:hypothetical protein